MQIKKYYLVLSFFMVSGIALLYGVSPQWFVRTFFDVTDLDRNFAHILRAVMCLYLGLGLFWLTSAFNAQWRDVALVTVLVFASGLLVGRLFSFAMDGRPSALLQFYAAIEAMFILVTYWVLRRPDSPRGIR